MTTTRLVTRAAQLVLLAGMSPAIAVDTAANQVSAAPTSVRLAVRILENATRDRLRKMAVE